MADFLIELRAQMIALATFFAFPIVQYAWLKILAKNKGQPEIWFLPDHHCCRLVMRNLPHRKVLYDIRYRALLRKVEPATSGSTVESYRDELLLDRDELFLFGEDDQVLVSFRIDGTSENDLSFVLTDKFGTQESRRSLRSVDLLITDYAATVKNLFNFDIRIAKRAEVSRETLHRVWQALALSPHEQCFYADRVRNVS